MKKTKSILALLVIIAMLIALVPFNVFAEGETPANIQLNGISSFANDGDVYTFSFDEGNTKTVEVSLANTTIRTVEGNNPIMLTVDAGKAFTFKFSQAGSIVIDGRTENLDANNSYTYTTVAKDGNAPTIMDFIFGNQQEQQPQMGFDGTTIQFDGATVSNNVITFDVAGTNVTATVTGTNGTFAFNQNGALEVDEGALNNIRIKLDNNFKSNEMGVRVIDNGESKEIIANGDNEITFNDVTITDKNLHLEIYKKQEGNSNPNGNNAQNGGPNDIEFDVKVTNSELNMWINNKEVMSDGDGVLKSEFKGTIKEAGFDGTDEKNPTNQLRFVPPFGSRDIVEYVINGVTYTKDSPNVQIGNPDWTITVPAAKKYVITAKADANQAVPRTIIWTNPGYVAKDAADAEWIKEFKLEHGSAYVKAVYDKDGNLVDASEYVSANWDKSEINRGVGKDFFGWITVKPGSKVVFEFVPEYGYQLTDIKINGQSLGAGDKINEFTFEMPDTNIHFDAVFTKTEDVVKANSKSVEAGQVKLGNNTLTGGTAQLSISDVELSEDKIKEFEKNAGDYKVTKYIGVDLYQVFYKGKNDANDVWKTQIDELTNEVIITLKLADGLTADDVVIVHNIHDGEKYEVIKIDSYDPTTNTITFRTKSFSNYAIATKEAEKKTETKTEAKEETKTTTNPGTGDNIALFITIFAVAALGVVVLAIVNKKNKANKEK